MEPTQSKYAEEKELGHASLGDVDVSEKEVTEEARLATHKEHNLSVRQGLKAYRKAIGWSILMSSAVIMEGYDTILVSLCFICASWYAFSAKCFEQNWAYLQIGSYLGFGSFNNTFGNQVVDGVPSITAPWQAAGTSCVMLRGPRSCCQYRMVPILVKSLVCNLPDTSSADMVTRRS
jgi:hypothetical protein